MKIGNSIPRLFEPLRDVFDSEVRKMFLDCLDDDRNSLTAAYTRCC